MELQVFVLTVSDRCYRKEAEDRGGPAVADVIVSFMRDRVLLQPQNLADSGSQERTGGTHDTNPGRSAFSSYSIQQKIVPDEIADIQAAITSFTDKAPEDTHTTKSNKSRATLLISTGGTGFSPRDVTPEAIKPLLHKEAPSLVTAMLLNSLPHCASAWLSRAVAGVRKQTMIISLPGSPNAVRECLLPLLETGLLHALELLAAPSTHDTPLASTRESNSPEVSAPPSEASPGFSVVKRPRNSTYPMVPMPEAAKMMEQAIAYPLQRLDQYLNEGHKRIESPSSTVAVDATDSSGSTPLGALSLISERVAVLVQLGIAEVVPLHEAIGRVLLQPVISTFPHPPFRASIKDGYAVVASDGTGTFPVVAAITAGDEPKSAMVRGPHHHIDPTPSFVLQPGQVCRVTTGGPVPDGADAVIQVEDTTLVEADETRDVELRVRIDKPAKAPGQDIRAVGSDMAPNTCVLHPGATVIHAAEIAIAASVGETHLCVLRRPTVAVMSTGNELSGPQPLQHRTESGNSHRSFSSAASPLPGKIYDSNRPMLLAALQECSLVGSSAIIDAGIAEDNLASTRRVVLHALQSADVVISSGGVSMGETDYVKHVIQDLGGVIHFGRVNMKPGKPTTFATFPNGLKLSAAEKASMDEASGATRAASPFSKVFFALPGNPASALVCFHLFVLPSLKYMSSVRQVDMDAILRFYSGTTPGTASGEEGSASSSPPPPSACCACSSIHLNGGSAGSTHLATSFPSLFTVRATLLADMKRDPERPEYHRCVVQLLSNSTEDTPTDIKSSEDGVQSQGNRFVAMTTGSQQSSRILSMATANGVAIIPAGEGSVRANEEVDVHILGPMSTVL